MQIRILNTSRVRFSFSRPSFQPSQSEDFVTRVLFPIAEVPFISRQRHLRSESRLLCLVAVSTSVWSTFNNIRDMISYSSSWPNSRAKGKQASVIWQGAFALNTVLILVAIPVGIDRVHPDIRNKWLLQEPKIRSSRVIYDKRKEYRRNIESNFPMQLASEIEHGFI